MTIEIVDFPLKRMIFHTYVSLPEGNYLLLRNQQEIQKHGNRINVSGCDLSVG